MRDAEAADERARHRDKRTPLPRAPPLIAAYEAPLRRVLLSSAVGSLLRAVLGLALRRGAVVAGALVAALHLARLAVRASAHAATAATDSASTSATATATSDVHALGALLQRLTKIEQSADVRLVLDALIDELPANVAANVRRRDVTADDDKAARAKDKRRKMKEKIMAKMLQQQQAFAADDEALVRQPCALCVLTCCVR
jgi:hypothetical protein